MKIMIIAGARPNFMKLAPIVKALGSCNGGSEERVDTVIVHTGQHYDEKMSKLFFEELEIPRPDINLEVGSGTHAVQTAEIIRRFEPVLLQEKPDIMIVMGDVNSTFACSLVASKIHYTGGERVRPVIAHVEAGLRSFDRTMPEEINRILTDAISDILFTTEKSANDNLLREGISPDKIHFVGNVMIDTLLRFREKASRSSILDDLGLASGVGAGKAVPFALLTLHRPSNVDNKEVLLGIMEALIDISRKLPIIFPAHPRTKRMIGQFNLENGLVFGCKDKNIQKNNIYCIDPLGYLDFFFLTSNARLVLTDSGGIQEETTVLGIPCVTLRENTERPVTVSQGTNVIAGVKKENIIKAALSRLESAGYMAPGSLRLPELWDGNAAERIIKILLDTDKALVTN